ncbi:MAG: DUF368 domain-containing protein [Candidatus Peribacteria bacterium]|nr:MAG: DUF368 domain-containing protein [Candidatus Peribacteria bacterium]
MIGLVLTQVTGSLGKGPVSLLLGGIFASIAMILPGISGSYILLIL